MVTLFLLLATTHGLVEYSPLRPGRYWLVSLGPVIAFTDEPAPPTRPSPLRKLGAHAALTAIVLLVLAGRSWLDPTARELFTVPLRFAWPWFVAATAGLHFLIDLATWLLFRLLVHSPSPGHYAWSFTLSQAAHYSALYYLSVLATDADLLPASQWQALEDWSALTRMLPQFIATSTPHLLSLTAVALPTLFGGAILIRLALTTRLLQLTDHSTGKSLAGEIKRAEVGDTGQVGVYIGILERLLTLLFLAAGDYSAVGLVLAAKSLARFRDLDDRPFAEYYIVGTLLSLTLATLGYWLLQLLLSSVHVSS